MSVALTIYSNRVIKEYILPQDADSIFKVHIDHSFFEIKEDITALLENISGKWYFKVSRNESTFKFENYNSENLNVGDVITIRTRYGEKIVVIVNSLEFSFLPYQKYLIKGKNNILIGTDENSDIVYDIQMTNHIVSGSHCQITKTRNETFLEDLSTNGSFVNGRKISENKELEYLDCIDIYGLKIIYLGDIIAVSGNIKDENIKLKKLSAKGIFENLNVHGNAMQGDGNKSLYTIYHRPPRNMRRLNSGNVIIENYPFSQKFARRILGITKKNYDRYLQNTKQNIQKLYDENTQILRSRYKNYEFDKIFNIPDDLWVKNKSHKDFWLCRIGMGDIPFQVKIETKENFLYGNYSDRVKNIEDSYKTLRDVPICIDFDENSRVGLVGDIESCGQYILCCDIVSQIVLQNSYKDVKLVFLLKDKTGFNDGKWSYVYWLPHVFMTGQDNRYVAFGKEEVDEVCYRLLDSLRCYDIIEEDKKNYFCVIVEDMSLIDDNPLKKYLFEKDYEKYIKTIVLSDNVMNLPNECNIVAEKSKNFEGIYSVREGNLNGHNVIFDKMTPKMVYDIAKKISQVEIEDTNIKGEIPRKISFLKLFDANNIEELDLEERYKRNKTYENISAIIGAKAGNNKQILDLNEKFHGPHGLIVGTTGSGKSELLKTLILSLAVNYSPDMVNFFLIDYKGGAMSRAFEKLPHVVGSISNLSSDLLVRAMLTIKSENKKRQIIFAKTRVSHIDEYTKLYEKGFVHLKIPHLFVVIDEFAMLKKENPEFINELISVARIGRSLGVHLILATQSGRNVIDENIISNSRFKIALKMQNESESINVLGKKDAAYLTENGRAILKAGNDEVYEEFQVSMCSMVYDIEETNQNVNVQFVTSLLDDDITGSFASGQNTMQKYRKFIRELILNNDFESFVGYENVQKQNLKDINEIVSSRLCVETYDVTDNKIDKIIEYAEKNNIRIPVIREKSLIEYIIEHINNVCQKLEIARPDKIWMPVLTDDIIVNDLKGFDKLIANRNLFSKTKVKAYVGLIDDPYNQYQMPFVIDLNKSYNMAILGQTMSGKTTFLQTFVYSLCKSYTKEDLKVYIISNDEKAFESFKDFENVIKVMSQPEEDDIQDVLMTIQKLFEQRKNKKENEYSDRIVFIIDGYETFKELMGREYDDVIYKIMRMAPKAGANVILSGQMFGMGYIPTKLQMAVQNIVALKLKDRSFYVDAFGISNIDVMPERNVKGRGIALFDDRILLFQTAVAECIDEDNRMTFIKKEARKLCEDKESRVCEIDENLNDIQKAQIADARIENIDKPKSFVIELSKTYTYYICGSKNTTDDFAKKILIYASKLSNTRSYIVDFDNDKLTYDEENYINNFRDFESFFKKICDEYKKRFEACKNGTWSNDSMDFDEIFILIKDLHIFEKEIKSFSSPNKNYYRAFLNLLEKGNGLNIFIFGSYENKNISKHEKIIKAFRKRGLGMNLESSKTVDVKII